MRRTVPLLGILAVLLVSGVRAAPPAVQRIDVTHDGDSLFVAATGTSLGTVTSATVLTPDSTWTIPLTIAAQTDSSLTATGVMSQALEGASLLLASGGGPVSPVPIRDDAVLQIADSLQAITHLRNLYDPLEPEARPKDFAFLTNTVYTPPPAGVGWVRVDHVFYIRHFTAANDDDNEKAFVHAWWRDDGIQRAWKFDTEAFRCGGTPWDGLHVWAPIVVFRGGQYVMFYTGVDFDHDQRIGYATTARIDTSDTTDDAWQRRSAPVFDAGNAGWTAKASPQQCRDPFVMPNPDGSGLVMLYAAQDSSTHAMAVGLATCPIGLDLWSDGGHFLATDGVHSHAQRLESPHAFADSASTTTAESLGIPLGEVPGVTWRILYSDGASADPDSAVRFITHTGSSFSDTSLSAWSEPVTLHSYTRNGPFDVNVKGLQATEYLRVGRAGLLAGFQGFVANGDTLFGIAFRRLYWPANPDFVMSDSAGVLTASSRTPVSSDLRLVVTELVPGEGRVRFRIETPVPLKARVVVYDVMGRRVRRLFDGSAPAGRTDVSWDGRSEVGRDARSGIYFVRLSAAGRSRAVRIPLVR